MIQLISRLDSFFLNLFLSFSICLVFEFSWERDIIAFILSNKSCNLNISRIYKCLQLCSEFTTTLLSETFSPCSQKDPEFPLDVYLLCIRWIMYLVDCDARLLNAWTNKMHNWKSAKCMHALYFSLTVHSDEIFINASVKWFGLNLTNNHSWLWQEICVLHVRLLLFYEDPQSKWCQ